MLSQHQSAVPPARCRMEIRFVNDDINVLALIKGKERYIFLYDDSQAPKRCGCSAGTPRTPS